MIPDPHFTETPDGNLHIGRHLVPPDMVRHVRFYLQHPPLALPHRHSEIEGLVISDLEIACDACGKIVPPDLIHGTIGDHPGCLEVRFTAPCPHCSSGRPRILHNVLRFRGDGDLDFMRDGIWMRTTSWWKWFRHRLGV